jgi:hypothetical protein
MKWLIWLGFAALALAIGLFFHHAVFTDHFSYSLDFGSLIDAFILLLVFVLIDYAYSRQSSSKKADTDLLLSVVQEAKAAFHHLEAQTRNCESGRALTEDEQVALTCAERELSNSICSIEDSLRYCELDLQKLKFEQLKDARTALKDSLTDSPYPGPYDHASRRLFRSTLRTMRDELTRIAFAINRR